MLKQFYKLLMVSVALLIFSSCAFQLSPTVNLDGDDNGNSNSNDNNDDGVVQAATPIISPDSGIVDVGALCTITCDTEEADIYYTVDSSAPSILSAPYTTPITINEATTINAICIKEGYTDSEIATAAYTVRPVPVVSSSYYRLVDEYQDEDGNVVREYNELEGGEEAYLAVGGEECEGLINVKAINSYLKITNTDGVLTGQMLFSEFVGAESDPCYGTVTSMIGGAYTGNIGSRAKSGSYSYDDEANIFTLTGNPNGVLLVGGYGVVTGQNQRPVYWDHASLTPSSFGSADTKAYVVTSITNYGGDIYAGGFVADTSAPPVRTPIYWENAVETAIANPLDVSKTAAINSILVSYNTVYAAGFSTNSSNIMIPGYWYKNVGSDSFTWQALPVPDGKNGNVFSIVADSGGNLYAGGFLQASDVDAKNQPGYWHKAKGAESWDAFVGFTRISSTKGGQINSMVVLSGHVYAAGLTTNTSGAGIQVPAYWEYELGGESDVRTDLTPLDATRNSAAMSLDVSNGNIYVGGNSQEAPGLQKPVYWSKIGSGEWSSANRLSVGSSGGGLAAIIVSESVIYAVGYNVDSDAGNKEKGCYWSSEDGLIRHQFSPLETGFHTRANALFVY